MTLALTILEIVAPVFILGAIGFTWVKVGIEYRITFVTQLAMTLAVPSLIFVSLMKTQIEPAALTAVTLASVAAYAVLSAVFVALVWLGRLDRATYAAPLIFGNTGNLGLPLALFAFGEIGLLVGVTFGHGIDLGLLLVLGDVIHVSFFQLSSLLFAGMEHDEVFICCGSFDSGLGWLHERLRRDLVSSLKVAESVLP